MFRERNDSKDRKSGIFEIPMKVEIAGVWKTSAHHFSDSPGNQTYGRR